MNIIFNELRQQRVKYVHTTSKIKSIHAIFYQILFLLLIYPLFYYFVMRSNTIRRVWVDLLSKSKHVKISLAVSAYKIAKFICTILCLAYTTLLQKVTMYACDYRTYYIPQSLHVDSQWKYNEWILLRAARQWAWRLLGCVSVLLFCTNAQCLLPALNGLKHSDWLR